VEEDGGVCDERCLEGHAGISPKRAFELAWALDVLSDQFHDEAVMLEDGEGIFIDELPPVAVRLATPDWVQRFAQCFADLRERLDAGEAHSTMTHCTGEEIALHLALNWVASADEMLPELPELEEVFVEQVDRDEELEWLDEVLFWDHDARQLYDMSMDGFEDPTTDLAQHLALANLHPYCWFMTFDGIVGSELDDPAELVAVETVLGATADDLVAAYHEVGERAPSAQRVDDPDIDGPAAARYCLQYLEARATGDPGAEHLVFARALWDTPPQALAGVTAFAVRHALGWAHMRPSLEEDYDKFADRITSSLIAASPVHGGHIETYRALVRALVDEDLNDGGGTTRAEIVINTLGPVHAARHLSRLLWMVLASEAAERVEPCGTWSANS
jgi:hypothetical protein